MPDVDSLFATNSENEQNDSTNVDSSNINLSSTDDSTTTLAKTDESSFNTKDSSPPTPPMSEHDQNSYAANNLRTLATVMENLPLSQDTFLPHHQKFDSISESDVESLSISDKNSVNNVTLDDVVNFVNIADNQSTNNIGHSRSAHSFGPGDYINSEQPRRTHMRHNSYEVTGINQNNCGGTNNLLAQQCGGGGCGAGNNNSSSFNRTNSLSSRTNDCSSYSSSSFSVSSLSCSDYSASITDYDVEGGGGGNGSKRSSLDRRSLASASENSDCGGAINATAAAAYIVQQQNEEWKFKRLPQITSILPKVLFSRKSSTSTSSGDSSSSGGDTNNGGGGCGPVDLWTLRSKFFRPSSSASASSSSSSTTNNNSCGGEVPSTTALILENRPACLPPKSAEEEQKHRLLYEQMVEAAKKKEQKEAKLKKKLQREQLRQEELLSAAVKEWTNEILPKWEELKSAKRTKELWGQGLPPCVRGKVWKLAIGNELNITEELFEICVNRAKERLHHYEEASRLENDKSQQKFCGDTSSVTSTTTTEDECPSSPVDRESTVELIHLDVARTFPTLGIFQKGGPYYDLLLNVLGAYVCYRPDVGYVQGMSFLAAILLLNLDVEDTFVAFANLMNRPCQLAFFRLRQLDMQRYFQAYDLFFEDCLPKLYNHFKSLEIRPNLYLIEWLYTLYAKSLPLEVTCRIWDSFLRDGEEFLFKTAVGILFHYEDILLRMDFDRCVQFLTHLPDNVRDKDLFKSIEKIKSGREHKKFGQILTELSSGSSTSPINRQKGGDYDSFSSSFSHISSSENINNSVNNSNEQTPVAENNDIVIISL